MYQINVILNRFYCCFAALIIIPAMLIYTGCNKDDNKPIEGSHLVSFEKIVAGSDTLYVGQLTSVEAVFEGNEVTFKWEATAGDILGNGASVQYLASHCAIGENTISCTATADNNSITRTLKIYVE